MKLMTPLHGTKWIVPFFYIKTKNKQKNKKKVNLK